MGPLDHHRRLQGLAGPRGPETRDLRLGEQSIRLEGLDPALAAALDRRWGGFLSRDTPVGPARQVIRVFDAGTCGWLPPARPREHYRIEALNDVAHRVVVSYHFAIGAEGESGRWRVGLTAASSEPAERSLENAIRFLVARAAVEDGGFALHAAGVLREERAYLLAGPSGAGKTTAVGQCRPAESLGDDFGLVLRGATGWCSAAVPFDNSERILHAPYRGLFPVAGVFRLHQSPDTRVDRPAELLGVASLLSCVAFAWALPDLSERLLGQVQRFVADGLFGHLHFALGDGLWTHLLRERR